MTTEFQLIDAIRARLGVRGGRVVLGSGDDAAVARAQGVTVTSVDAFVEDVHFRLATTSMRDLGHRCLAAAVSDLAAMGCEPGEAYLVLGLPPQIGEREALELADGAEALAAGLGISICGGDITRCPKLLVSVTAVGHADDEGDLVLRSGALPGDLLGVTGSLGGSGAGLLALERKTGGLDQAVGAALLERHLRPQPRVEAGLALARAGVHAMIDLSDGVASDCERISERSGVLVEVHLPVLPLDEGVETVAAAVGVEPADFAATAGEDYELMFAAGPESRRAVESAAAATGTAVTWIGRVREGAGVRLLDAAGAPRPLRGWDHLARPGEDARPARA
jgi:thiamine-monophosphate kinase